MNSKCIPNPGVLNKQLWTYKYINGILCSHLKEQESLYVLMWNNIQDILICREKMTCKSVYTMLPFVDFF